jgi:pleiotropic regulator 1
MLSPLLLAGWDLEYNKVVRNYHGHLSGVFDLKIHPTLDVIVTGGRDCVARVGTLPCRMSSYVLSHVFDVPSHV